MSDATRPPAYFALPPGFYRLDTSLTESGLRASTAGLRAAAEPEFAAGLDAAVSALARQLEAYRQAHITFAAVGAHPRAGGGMDASAFSASVQVVAAQPDVGLLPSVAMAEAEFPDTRGVEVRDFPAGPAVVSERQQLPEPLPGADGPLPGALPIYTIRVTFALPDPGQLLVLELSTQVAGRWTDYKNVMTGMIAKTVTFDNPVEKNARRRAITNKASSLKTRLG